MAKGWALAGVLAAVAVAAGWWLGHHTATPDAQRVTAVVRELRQLAVVRVTLGTIQRGTVHDRGLVLRNEDDVLCRFGLDADYGFDLDRLDAASVTCSPGRIVLHLPRPHILPPGILSRPPEVLDLRTTRWFSDPGPSQAAAIQAARTAAIAEAPQRLAALDLDREVAQATRSALTRILPRLLADPRLQVEVRIDGLDREGAR